MRILLTGATGFLGSALAHHWSKCGYELWLPMRPTSRNDRISGLLDVAHVMPVTSTQDITALISHARPEVVVHTACAYGRSGEKPIDLLDANFRFGALLLQALIDSSHRAKQPVTFINTGSVLAPDVSMYALSKHQFSMWGDALAKQAEDKLRFIDVKLQQMYGCGDDRSKFIMNVIEACRLDELHLALTKGEQRRDLIHIDDVVSAFDCILGQRHLFAASEQIEVGSGEAVTMRSFVELVKTLAGAATSLDFGAVPYRAHEAMLSVADTTRLRSLGWQPKVTLENGLRQILNASHGV